MQREYRLIEAVNCCLDFRILGRYVCLNGPSRREPLFLFGVRRLLDLMLPGAKWSGPPPSDRQSRSFGAYLRGSYRPDMLICTIWVLRDQVAAGFPVRMLNRVGTSRSCPGPSDKQLILSFLSHSTLVIKEGSRRHVRSPVAKVTGNKI